MNLYKHILKRLAFQFNFWDKEKGKKTFERNKAKKAKNEKEKRRRANKNASKVRRQQRKK